MAKNKNNNDDDRNSSTGNNTTNSNIKNKKGKKRGRSRTKKIAIHNDHNTNSFGSQTVNRDENGLPVRKVDDERSLSPVPNPHPKAFTKHPIADMMRFGITKDHVNLAKETSEIDNSKTSLRALARIESAQILSKKFMVRDNVKKKILTEHDRVISRVANNRVKKIIEWEYKTKNSPFQVDLLAENERVSEENTIRLQEEERKKKVAEKRKEMAKSKIILKALSETSDLEALRREKRAILDEEKRLKALLDLEKMKLHTKEDVLLAQRAERQRKEKKREFRRKLVKSIHDEEVKAKQNILSEFLDVKPRPDNTFTSFGIDDPLPRQI